MNNAIAEIFNSYLLTLPFADRVAGVVRAVTLVSGADKPIKKTIPIACNVSEPDCVTGQYTDLVPNSKYKSIMYWEDNGVKINTANQTRDFNFTSSLRLVVWINLKKVGKTDCNVSALAVTNILNTIPTNYFNSGIYTRIRAVVNSEIVKSPAIFSKYTYDEATTQYLMFPFDYFALDIDTTFTIPKSCIVDWENETPIICDTK